MSTQAHSVNTLGCLQQANFANLNLPEAYSPRRDNTRLSYLREVTDHHLCQAKWQTPWQNWSATSYYILHAELASCEFPTQKEHVSCLATDSHSREKWSAMWSATNCPTGNW